MGIEFYKDKKGWNQLVEDRNIQLVGKKVKVKPSKRDYWQSVIQSFVGNEYSIKSVDTSIYDSDKYSINLEGIKSLSFSLEDLQFIEDKQ